MSEDGDRPMRESLKRVAVALKQAGIPFALGGGYAGWARGGPEPEHDVDFLLQEEHTDQALHVLRDAGLRVDRPPEDWLVKVYDGEVLVDLVFRPAQRPVTPEILERATEVEVDSVAMPVLSATDLMLTKLLVLNEHYCDFSKIYPHVRALREQVDWQTVRESVSGSPFARAFLVTCEEIGILEPAAHQQDRAS